MRISRIAYWLGVLVIPAMLAEMTISQLKGTFSLKVVLVFTALAVLSVRTLRITRWYGVHVFMVCAFVAVGLLWGGLSRYVLSELLNAAQALLFLPVLAAFLRSTGYEDRYVRDTAHVAVLLGVAVAVIAQGKFMLLTQGVYIGSLYAADGMYPLGTSMHIDYNVFALGLLCALASAMWVRNRPDTDAAMRLLCTAAVPFLAVTVILSFSRRGVLLLTGLFAAQFFFRRGAVSGYRRFVGIFPALAAMLLVGLILAGLLFEMHNPVYAFAQNHLDLESLTARLQTIRQSDELTGSRMPRFEFAWIRFTEEYSIAQMLFGNGFSYLEDMGAAFDTSVGYDYPHNFLLSALLYGGLSQTLVLCALIVGALKYYGQHRSDFGPFLIMFVFSLFFGLTSSNSIYNVELLYLLLVMAAFPWGSREPAPSTGIDRSWHPLDRTIDDASPVGAATIHLR